MYRFLKGNDSVVGLRVATSPSTLNHDFKNKEINYARNDSLYFSFDVFNKFNLKITETAPFEKKRDFRTFWAMGVALYSWFEIAGSVQIQVCCKDLSYSRMPNMQVLYTAIECEWIPHWSVRMSVRWTDVQVLWSFKFELQWIDSEYNYLIYWHMRFLWLIWRWVNQKDWLLTISSNIIQYDAVDLVGITRISYKLLLTHSVKRL